MACRLQKTVKSGHVSHRALGMCIFSTNDRAQSCLLNMSVCKEKQTGSIPVLKALLKYEFKDKMNSSGIWFCQDNAFCT